MIDPWEVGTRVPHGSTVALHGYRQARFVGGDAGALSRFGNSRAEVFSFLEGVGSFPQWLTLQWAEPMAIRLTEERVERDGYTDILYLAERSMAEGTAACEADFQVRTS